MRKIIFGVYENSSSSYFGYFEHSEDAIKELITQKKRLESETGTSLVHTNHKVTDENNKVVLIIHPIVLR